MQNISWLESLAAMTTYDTGIDDLLKSQPYSIQQAYQSNDHSMFRNLMGGSDRLASKNTIFQL